MAAERAAFIEHTVPRAHRLTRHRIGPDLLCWLPMAAAWTPRLYFVLWAAVAAVGCSTLLDLDAYSTGSAGDGAGGSGAGVGGSQGGGGLASCGQAGVCAAPPPAGWHGPVALVEGGCGGSYPVAATAGTEVVAAPPAACTCSCGPPAGELCGGPQLSMSTTGSCVAPSGNPWATGCVGSISPPPVSVNAMRAHPAQPTPGSCEAIFTATNPPISSRELTLCGYEDAATGCPSGQICAPDPSAGFDRILCIYAEGEPECPSSIGYSDAHVIYAGGLEDNRSCTPCSCEASAGASCTGTTSVYSFSACNTLKATVPHDDSCVTFSAGIGSINTSVQVVAGSCPAVGGVADGDVTGVSPITLCCTPPL